MPVTTNLARLGCRQLFGVVGQPRTPETFTRAAGNM